MTVSADRAINRADSVDYTNRAVCVDRAIERALAEHAPNTQGGGETSGTSTRATDAQARALLSLMADLPAGADRERVRARLIELYIPLAEYL
ncbi:hypothetical protein ABT297_17010, partial [Dactylosporangium sp. NPDC000555]|uniref:hypothetical protein n=1 Tax=Dactylosporangium sp. NPDC000555 TaxID=3154260 RepID=UPI003323B676